MKKISLITILAFSLNSSYISGQVAIGKESINGVSTLLDFNSPSDNFRGLILPSVDNVPSLTSANNGTFLFDKSDKKVKMYENGTWIELSNPGSISQITINTSAESTKNQGVIIGASASNAKGVLVLESPDKAMLLPKINAPHTTVKSPYPGMMCYDAESKSLAVFDGSNWNYWK